MVKPYLKNKSAISSIKKLSVKITCNDPWVSSTQNNLNALPEILPGKSVTTSVWAWLLINDALFPGYFNNFEVEISSDDYVYWTDSVQLKPGFDGIKEDLLQAAFKLEQNYPNPFNSVTTINWQIPHSSQVTLKVLDIIGRTVATLVDEQRPSGKYESQFDAATLPKGIYFYQLKAGEFSQTRKMVLMK